MLHANDDLLSRLPTIQGSYRVGADLSKINWFNVGGKADVMFRPKDTEDLAYFIQHCPKDIPVTVLGVGSNLLVRDGGIEGVVIRLGREFATIRVNKERSLIHAGAGALDFNVAQLALEHHIGGMEFLVGIPGTIGGAVAMNAGAYLSDIASIVQEVEAVDETGMVHYLSPDDIGFIYRGNTLPEGMIFTKAILQGKAEDYAVIQSRMEEINHKRQSTQPVREKTSGSTFRNPPNHKAWQLIDQAGCRGLRVGDAMVSEKHCNFFINMGNATAQDIETLGETVRQRVQEHSGVLLEWEVKIVGRQ